MTNLRLVVAQGLGAVAVVLALINDLGLASYLDVPVRTSGILALILATAAFFVAMRQGSLVLSAFLIVQGISDVSASLLAGAIIGVPFGLWVLALGAAKSVITAREMKRKKPTSTVSQSNNKGKIKEKSGITKFVAVVIVVILVVIAAVGVIYFASSTSSPSSSTMCALQSSVSSASIVQVFITNGALSRSNAPGYAPDNLTLVIGVNNTVTWTNDDSVAHTVTSSTAPSCGAFNSGNMNAAAVYTHTFTVPGTYQYYCKYHSWMTGTIVVEAGS